MSIKWSDNQLKAIDIRNTNTLVSAAAGSGKTAVLVERVIKMITNESEKVYISDLLIATYTNAAASEMRERIYKALQEKINEQPDNEYFNRQLILLGQAQITTVHSFCINLLREYFHILGISHDFEIAEESVLSSLKEEAFENLLKRQYEKGDKDFLDLVDAYGGKRGDNSIVDMINSIAVFSESLPYPFKWLADCYENPIPLEEYKAFINDYIKGVIYDIISRYKSALECIDSDEGLAPYKPFYENEANAFNEIIKKDDDIDYNLLSNFSFNNLSGKSGNADENSVVYVRSVRDYAKKQLKKISEIGLAPDEDLQKDLDVVIKSEKTVCKLVAEYLNELSDLKLKANLLTFSDLEHYTIKLLDENVDIRNTVKSKYKEIFVDEYQDTNAVQAKLFELLSNGENLFMVGDVKQSIYGFRNSNPEFFIDKYNNYGFEKNERGIKILLSHNYRSSNGVLEFVNRIFYKLMSKESGGVDYNDEHKLVYGNTDITDFPISAEVHIVDKKADIDSMEDAPILNYDNAIIEAMLVADRIIDLVEIKKPQIYDSGKKAYRAVTYKDIAVLMRKTKSVSEVYAEVFASKGIPAYTEASGGYFASNEIATIISYLKIIQNPMQDIPMLAVMRSPIFAFDDNLLAELRSKNRHINIYSLLKSSDNVKAKEFISELEYMTELSKTNDVGYIVRRLVYDTGYYRFVGGLPNGKKRMLNLSLLCDRATDFSKNGHKGILSFIRYIQNMISSNKEYKSAKITGANDDVVTIMTVHKSKGLEFPVVFLAGCGTKFNKNDLSKPYVYDPHFGIAFDVIDYKRRLKYSPYVKKALKLKKESELIAEEIRLLYVAMTRAKYKLIITGVKDNSYKKYGFEPTEITPNYVLSKNDYISWIIDILGMKNINVHIPLNLLGNSKKESDKISHSHDKSYSEYKEEINRRLQYVYPYTSSKNIPAKKSISEFISGDDSYVDLFKINNSSELNSAQRGTVIHFILQNIDLKNVSSRDDIEFQINKMEEDGMLQSEYVKYIDIDAIYDFFASKTGIRMLKSDRIYREFKFCVELEDAALGYEASGEMVLVQGVVDCCFEENGEFVIIDYKTGSMHEKYKKQLELYSSCIEAATGKKVKETIIYPII